MSHIKYLCIASLAAALSLPASSAMADKAKKSKAAKTTKAVQPSATPSPAKAKNFDFMADEIDGSRILPDNTTIFGREDVTHHSLIRLRTEFIAEIVKSAEML